MRMTSFSPNATAMVDTRISTSRSPRAVLMRPSCGRRFSAMSRRASVLMRETTAAWTTFGSVCTLCRTPSMRMRTAEMLAPRLDVHVAGALVERVVQEVLDRGDDVAVARLDLLDALELDVPLEVADVDAAARLLLGGVDRAAEAVEVGDEPLDLRRRRRRRAAARGARGSAGPRRASGRAGPPRRRSRCGRRRR